MRKRPRPSCSFQPKSDELEKLTGASTLSVAGLLATSLQAVGQPATQSPVILPVAPSNGPGLVAPRSPAAPVLAITPKAQPKSDPTPRVLLTSQSDQAPSRIELPSRLVS